MSETENSKQEKDEVEEAARNFYHIALIFQKMVYDLAKRKKRAVPRVLTAFMLEPFENVTLVGKEEEELLAICHQMNYYKSKIATYAMERNDLLNDKGENNDESKNNT